MSNPDAQLVAETMLSFPACLIVTHVNPEGDAIGTQLALALALEQRGITVTCYDRDGVPDNNRFLPTWERVATTLPEVIPPLVIYVDADRLERCNVSVEALVGAEAFVRIDHHVDTQPSLGPKLVDTRAAATGELLYTLLPYLGAQLTPEIATCLHTALMVDTGRFSYSNTTPNTLHVAAELVAAGADVASIVEWVWGRASLAGTRLLGRVMAGVQASDDGRIVWSVLTAQDFIDCGASADDTEGAIDRIRCIRDVEVAALFSEKHGEVRVSLRSHGHVDVAAVARHFGGGGHVKAAGLTYAGPMANAVDAVIGVIARALDAVPEPQ